MQIRIESLIGGWISLERLHVVEPRVSITVFDDGSTNVPSPPRPSGPAERELFSIRPLLDLAVKEFRIDGGTLAWNGQPYAAAVQASDLTLETAWRPNAPEYAIRLEVGDLDWSAPALRGMPASLALEAVVGGDGIELTRFEAANDAVSVEASGRLADFRQPRFTVDYRASAHIGNLTRAYGIENARIDGSLKIDGGIVRQSEAAGVSYFGDIVFSEVGIGGSKETLAGRLRYRGNREQAAMTDIRLAALDGQLAGEARVSALAAAPRFDLSGTAAGFSISRLAKVAGRGLSALGRIDPRRVRRRRLLLLRSCGAPKLRRRTAAAAGAFPLRGRGEARYDGASRQLEIAALQLRSLGSTVDLSGSVDVTGQAALEVGARLTALDELDPLLRSLGVEAATPHLAGGGEMRIDGG